MNSARDHEKRLTQFFRDNPQIRNVLKFGRDTMNTGDSSSGRTWEEWVETTSRQQVDLLREKARKKALYATKRYRQMRIGRYALLSAAAAVIVFLSVVPTGRAFASAAMHNVTNLVNQLFYMQSQPANDIIVDNEPTGSAALPLTNLDKVKKAARYVNEPLFYMKEPGLTVADVSVSSMAGADTVTIEYRTANDDSIRTSQTIMQSEAGWGATLDTGGEKPKTHVLYNGEILYYAYTREGYAFGMAHWEGTSFTISSTTLKWEDLLGYVDTLAPVE